MFDYILWPFQRANEMGKTTVVIDPNPSENIRNMCKYVFNKKAENFLPKLIDKVASKFCTLPKPCQLQMNA